MYETKEKITFSKEVKVSVLKIRMMTDEEWNRIAYKQYLERKEEKDVRS